MSTLHAAARRFLEDAEEEALRPRARRDLLVELAGSIAPDERAAAIAAAECFLARIDPEWAAALVERFIPADEIAQSGVLGLSIAAFANDDRSRLPEWVISPPPSRVIYARALAADAVARAAARGTISSKNDPAFASLHEDASARFLLPFEASSYLVAAAIVDPAWGLDLASAMLTTHSPLDMTDALYFCARRAARSGLESRVVELSERGEFVLEQACWIEAAARAGALERSQVTQLCSGLADRITDELSEEGAKSAGTALVLALAHVGASDRISKPEASPWLVTPGSLLDLTCVAEKRQSLLQD